MTIIDEIANIEKILRETPHHKATDHFIGRMRAKIARLKDKEIESDTQRRQGSGGQGYSVKKRGDATAVLVGPPSAGKSTLLNKITNTQSKVASYAFTTVSVIPGMLKYKDAYIQILDIPGLIEGAKEGKGKGKEVLSVARNADILIFITDIQREEIFSKMLDELHGAGIRINQKRPDISIEKKLSGGLIFHSNIRQDLSKETFMEIAVEFGYKNAEITLKEKFNIERLIDAFSSSRVYIPAIFIVNKIDMLSGSYSPISGAIPISAESGNNLDKLKETIWEKLGLVRVYLIKVDEKPHFNNPMVMKKENNLKDVAGKLGTDFSQSKKLAKIWNTGARFPGQEVSFSTKVQEGMQVRFKGSL
ncbi:MAG: GTPase [bacterium]|nr:GTPase [bacterium]